MTNTYAFINAGADVDDIRLAALIRAAFMDQHDHDRLNWLKQIELGLDGYGERHRETADRVRAILHQLTAEHRATQHAAMRHPSEVSS